RGEGIKAQSGGGAGGNPEGSAKPSQERKHGQAVRAGKYSPIWMFAARGRNRSLQHGPRILVLPNAWDVASARIVEELGFPAIATTSAGIAFSLGYPDGQKISRE